MNRFEALHKFYSGFGMKAYEENSVPDEVRAGDMPYITYESLVSSLDAQQVALSCQIYYKSNSLMKINATVDKISDALAGGCKLQCDTGYIILYRGTPFAQGVPSGDKSVKAKYINITADYITL